MKKEYSAIYQIIKNHRLILEKHKGMVDGEKLAKFLKLKELDKDFSVDYNYLIDLRETSFSKNVQKVQDFVSYFRNSHKGILNCKIAFVATESDQVAMATLFRMLHGGVSRKVYVFSSVEYALYWLKSKITEEEAERILSQLTPVKV